MNEPDLQIGREKLSPAQFEKLLRGLDRDRERAGQKYEDLRLLLIRFFDWNACPGAEEHADETLNRVARRLEEEDILDIAAFAWGVAKNIRREVASKSRRLISLDDLGDEGLPLRDNRDTEKELYDQFEKAHRVACLRVCLSKLSKGDRDLFVSYHVPAGERSEARRELARVAGLSLGALRMKVIRLRQKLEKCTRRCVSSPRRRDMEQSDRLGGALPNE